MKTIKEEFERFWAEAYKGMNVPRASQQFRQLERAFYVGALVGFKKPLEIAQGHPGDPAGQKSGFLRVQTEIIDHLRNSLNRESFFENIKGQS